MSFRLDFIITALSLLCTSVTLEGTASASPETGFKQSPSGFYPIWENTGFVPKHRDLYIGTNGAKFGIGNYMALGLEPVQFVYRAPNANAKFALFETDKWSLATQIGVLELLDQASRAFFSPMYSSRLDNPDFNITLLPASVSATYSLRDWLELHQTVTGLGVFTSGALQNQAYFGYSAVGEFIASSHHSALIHLSEVGLWNHDFSMLGASYRYQSSWFEFRLGYFYRFRT